MSPGGAPEISTEPPRRAEEELGRTTLTAPQGPRRHHAGGARRRVRRHRHEPAVRDAHGVRDRPRPAPDRGRRLRRHLARVLGDHAGRHGQVRPADHARRQPRRGRDHGPDRAGARHPGRPALHQAGARLARHLRRGAVLRRRDDHAGDLGAVGGRGPRGGVAVDRIARGADHAHDRHLPVRRAALRDERRRPRVRPGDGAVVRDPRRLRARPRARRPRDPARALAPLRGRVPVRARLGRVPRARRRGAGDHGRRGAVRRHGPLRPQRDPARVAVRRLPRADAQLHGPGRR